jgi:hypothetical protein
MSLLVQRCENETRQAIGTVQYLSAQVRTEWNERRARQNRQKNTYPTFNRIQSRESKESKTKLCRNNNTRILQLGLEILKLAQILDHPGTLASRQTGLPSPDVLDQNRLLLLLLVVSVHLLITVGLGMTVDLLLRRRRRRSKVQRRQNLLQKTLALLSQSLDLIFRHACRVAEVRRHGGQNTLRVCVGVEVEFGQALR